MTYLGDILILPDSYINSVICHRPNSDDLNVACAVSPSHRRIDI